VFAEAHRWLPRHTLKQRAQPFSPLQDTGNPEKGVLGLTEFGVVTYSFG
jgi:hypothetical protein